jgi:hypothetical protein
MNLYALEKLRELERERLNGRLIVPDQAVSPVRRRRPVFGPLAGRAGRSLRRLGEGLEAWSRPPCEERPKSPLSYRR